MSREKDAPRPEDNTWSVQVDWSDSYALSDHGLDNVAGGVGIPHILSVSPVTPSIPVVIEQKQETLKPPKNPS